MKAVSDFTQGRIIFPLIKFLNLFLRQSFQELQAYQPPRFSKGVQR